MSLSCFVKKLVENKQTKLIHMLMEPVEPGMHRCPWGHGGQSVMKLAVSLQKDSDSFGKRSVGR